MRDETGQLGVSLEGIPNSSALLLDAFVPANEPVIQSRLLAARNERRSAVLSVAQTSGIIFTLLLTLALALWNGHLESKHESGDMMIKFTELLNSVQSRLIQTALDMNGNLNDIKLSGEALDDFLSNYNMLDAAYRNGLIDEDMVADAFSYDLERRCVTPK